MKKISYEELGLYLKRKCEDEFGCWFSDYWRDYEEELTNANVEKEEGNLTYQTIEIKHNNKVLNINLIYDFENDEYLVEEGK